MPALSLSRTLTIGIISSEEKGSKFLVTVSDSVAKRRAAYTYDDRPLLHLSENLPRAAFRRAVGVCCRRNRCPWELAARMGLGLRVSPHNDDSTGTEPTVRIRLIVQGTFHAIRDLVKPASG